MHKSASCLLSLRFESQLVKSFESSIFLQWATRLLPFYHHIFYICNPSENSEDTQIEAYSYNQVILLPFSKTSLSFFLMRHFLRVSLTSSIVMCNISASFLPFSNFQRNHHNEARFKTSLFLDKYYRSDNGDGGEDVIAGHNLISLSVRCATKLLRPFEEGHHPGFSQYCKLSLFN